VLEITRFFPPSFPPLSISFSENLKRLWCRSPPLCLLRSSPQQKPSCSYESFPSVLAIRRSLLPGCLKRLPPQCRPHPTDSATIFLISYSSCLFPISHAVRCEASLSGRFFLRDLFPAKSLPPQNISGQWFSRV